MGMGQLEFHSLHLVHFRVNVKQSNTLSEKLSYAYNST